MELPSIWKAATGAHEGKDAQSDGRTAAANAFRFAMRNANDFELDDILFRIVYNWPLVLDRRVLIGSTMLINVASGISSYYVHSMIRREFFVSEMAKVRSTFSSYLMPTALSTVLFFVAVWRPMTYRIFRDEADKPVCPLCFEMRQLFVSLSSGLLIPLFAAPLHSAYVVLGTQAYDIPPVRQFGRWCRFFGARMAPIKTKLPYLVIGHTLLSTATVYLQLKYLTGMAKSLDVDPEIFYHLQSAHDKHTLNPVAKVRAWLAKTFNIARWQ
uniref:Uncharacterized protein n=1 Tax=Trichuris muris TaxID=70415 RepID=A0A5S6QZG8_TRIMR